MEAISRAQALMNSHRQEEAEALLREALAEAPQEPDLHAELGLVCCYTQREFEAVEHYEAAKGARSEAKLGQILADYFYCRSQMAAKLGVADDEAKALAKRVPVPHDPAVGITLSACLIVKNEEKNLDRCLKSLVPICDEIVVVDTGSSDRTVEIAQQYGAKVGHFQWIGDFAAARNASLEMASGHWALWIDADEELPAEAIPSFREGLMRPHFGGYFIQIVNFMDAENPANQYVHTPVRLFRCIPEIRFEGRVHEQVLQDFDRHGFLTATMTNAQLYHYGYQAESMKDKDKINRTISMLEKEVRDHARDPFQWFNLANAYCVARRYPDAERAARIAIHFLEPHTPYGPVTYQILTTALLAQGKALEALQAGEDAEMTGNFTIINQFELAHSFYKLERYEDALAAVDRCRAMPWPKDLAGDYAIKTYKSMVLRAQILTELQRFSEAESYFRDALEIDPSFGLTHFGLGTLYKKMGKPGLAAEHFERAVAMPGLGDCLILAAQCWRDAGDIPRAAARMGEAWQNGKDRADLTAAWLQLADQTGDVNYRLEAYSQVGETGLESPDFLVNWGRALAESGDIAAGIGSFHRAYELDPSNLNALYNLGDWFFRVGHYLDAATAYEASLRLQPTNAEAWFVLGNCLAHLGQREGAITSYEECLRLNPQHTGAQNNRSIVSEEVAA